MAKILHTQLFDFDAYQKAIRDIQKNTEDFGKSTEVVLKRLATQYKELQGSFQDLANVLKNYNVLQVGAKDQLKTYSDQIHALKDEINGLRAVQQGIASINNLTTASVKELEAEYKGLQAQYKALKPSQTDYQQQVGQITARIKQVVPQISSMSAALKASKAGVDAAEGSYRRMQTELGNLRTKLRDLPGAFDPLTGRMNKNNKEALDLTTRIQQLDKTLKEADAHMGMHFRNVGNYASGFNGLRHSINQISREAPAFANSMQTGFMAISNNLPMLIDEINNLKRANLELAASGEKPKSIFKQLASALFSWQTLISVGITLLTVYGKEIVHWIGSLFGAKSALDKTKEAQELLNKALSGGDYTAAVKNVELLRINIDLAKQGFLNKKDVVDQYNESIGKSTGQVKNLEEAEKELEKNADAYIKMTLYKAAANLALEDAAKKAYQAALEGQKKAETFATFSDRAVATPIPTPGQKTPEPTQFQKDFLKKQSIQRQKDAVKILDDEATAFEKIAKDFQTKAAKIATEFKIDPFGNKDKKDKYAKKTGDDLEKQARDLIHRQQKLAEEIAELEISRNELKLAADEINEKEFQERKLKLITDYAAKAIELEMKLGKAADESRIIGFKKKILEAQKEFEVFEQKLAERMRTPLPDIVNLRSVIQPGKTDATGEIDTDKVIEAQKEKAQAAVEAENKAFELIAAGRDTSFREEIDHLNRLKDIKLANAQSTADEDYAIKRLHAERTKQLEQETAQFVMDVFSTGLQIIQQQAAANSEARIASLENEKQRELALAGNNTAAKEKIEKDYNEKIKKEKRRAAQQEKNFALFNIAIDTAASIVKTFRIWGWPAGIPFAALALGQGLLQAAVVASRPIPQFKKGTKNAPAGLALTGEEGYELKEHKGKWSVVSGLTLLKGGEKIYPHEQSRQIVEQSMRAQEARKYADNGLLHQTLAAQLRIGKQREMVSVQAQAFQQSFDQRSLEAAFSKAVKEIPIEKTIMDERGMTRRREELNIKTTYLNNRYKL
jgi:hypothetical protein